MKASEDLFNGGHNARNIYIERLVSRIANLMVKWIILILSLAFLFG